ncbi:MAG: hypothetical protein N2037_06730 [Acidimicrobiales bacterium]|nr:hypothetical protein [Acidimicrobiales bacterium]
MQVTIGPAPSDSALAYIDLCRRRLAELQGEPTLRGVLTPFVVAEFTRLLDQWEQTAHDGDPFVWEAEIDTEVVEHVFYAFFCCVRRVNELYGDSEPRADVEKRRPFRFALTHGILNALEAEGKASGALARELRENWPDNDID